MHQKAIVIEMNEVPLKVLRHFKKLRPHSNISLLLQKSLVLETEAKDVTEDFLYPSQTWGSLNTGAAYDLHKIHWYNDPKPDCYPLYWKTIADNGFDVGTINTLHSSPANNYIDRENYKFVIPDCFASNNITKPQLYQDFQALNTSATSENGRTSSLKLPLQKALSTLVKAPALGMKTKTLLDAAGLVTQIKLGKVNKERLRNLQFTLMADIFFKQIKSQDVDLAVFFTNHIAGNMHRYWYGLFPEDYQQELYDQKWMERFSQEILVAVELFDRFLGRIIKFCQQNKRTLILVSSMGQAANQDLTETPKYFYKLENVSQLLEPLCSGKQYSYQVDAAMVPQYSLAFDSAAEAEECFEAILNSKKYMKNIWLEADCNDKVITLSTNLGYDCNEFFIKGKSYSYDELGYKQIPIEDHHSGRHCPLGSLIVFNSQTSSSNTERIDYLEFAPALLKYFALEPLNYMIEPQFTI